jgi:nitrilase
VPKRDGDEVNHGSSCIVGPRFTVARTTGSSRSMLGQLIAGPNFECEAILTADDDVTEIACDKNDFDVVGHYAQPDVVRLTIDERPRESVPFGNDA